MPKKIKILFLGLLAPALLLTACQIRMPDSGPPKPAVTEVTISQSAPVLLSLPLYLADSLGFFAEENIQVRLLTKASPEEALASLMGGESAFALATPEIAFYHSLQQNAGPTVFLAQLSVKSGYYLLAREDAVSFAWPNLRGKSIIARPSGSMAEIFFEYLLRKNNLRASLDVPVIQNLPEHLIKGAFLAGTGNFVLAAEPLAADLEIETAAHSVAALEVPLDPLVTTVMMTTPDQLQNNLQMTQGLFFALQQALVWIDAHPPEEIAQAAKEFFPAYGERMLLRAVSRYKTTGCWPVQAAVETAGVHNFMQLMLENKELGEEISVEQFIYRLPAEEDSGEISF
ncbi:MAG: ABC transporter substrate-binding protein [Clostridia bacterium]|jgi:NitT/TauT family transport system substrate-binding protein|nr:ABC transporter substrate-binding protein [Clostridia bacterium]